MFDLGSAAEKTWQIAPGETQVLSPCFFLPGQLDRVTGTAFVSDAFPRDIHGGLSVQHAPTMGHLIEDALFIDGTIYKNDTRRYLMPRRKAVPGANVDEEIAHGALYATPGGIRFFGQWLIDDCVTYPLAQAEGLPLATDHVLSGHAAAYEELLGMKPHRTDHAFVRKLVVFDDFGQNADKRSRFRRIGAKLVDHFGSGSHPGVYVLRKISGTSRILENEHELAERLHENRGFRIIDPMTSTVNEIQKACIGAQVVISVEGSHLVHAILTMEPGASLMTIMPPTRFCTILKDVADREGLQFGFVVGCPTTEGFVADIDEIERTIDLMLAGAKHHPGMM